MAGKVWRSCSPLGQPGPTRQEKAQARCESSAKHSKREAFHRAAKGPTVSAEKAIQSAAWTVCASSQNHAHGMNDSVCVSRVPLQKVTPLYTRVRARECLTFHSGTRDTQGPA